MNNQSLLFSLPPSSPTASLPISSHPQVRLVVALCSLEYTALRPAQQWNRRRSTSCSRPLTGRGKWTTTAMRSCRYILPIVNGGGLGSGIVLKSFMPCQQQLTSSLGSHFKELMWLRGLFGAINPFKCVTTSTVSTTSLERRSVERNAESIVATTPRLNLDWIASWTMMRLRQVSILSPPRSLAGECPPACCQVDVHVDS